jgi:hypothetical protein
VHERGGDDAEEALEDLEWSGEDREGHWFYGRGIAFLHAESLTVDIRFS